MVRSRAQLNEAEKPTKFFCELEKKNYIDKTIKKIKLDTGEFVTEQKEILSEIQEFYKKRFASGDNQLSEYAEGELNVVKWRCFFFKYFENINYIYNQLFTHTKFINTEEYIYQPTPQNILQHTTNQYKLEHTRLKPLKCSLPELSLSLTEKSL